MISGWDWSFVDVWFRVWGLRDRQTDRELKALQVWAFGWRRGDGESGFAESVVPRASSNT